MSRNKWINISKLDKQDHDKFMKEYTNCGYIRNPKLKRDWTQLKGKCSLTGEYCTHDLPLLTYDCDVAFDTLNSWRAEKGLPAILTREELRTNNL